MHLQATVDYEHFARALSIGPETMVMDFRPDQPMHNRYAVSHGFLSPSRPAGRPAAISRIVNAFFQWEFNSAEMLVARRRGLPDRLRERLPRRRDHVAALLLPVGDQGARALVDVLRGDRPPVERRPADERYFEIADQPGTVVRGEARGPTSRSPTSTSRPSGTASGATSTCRTSTSRSRLGQAPTTSTGSSATRSPRPTPRTSRRVPRPLPRAHRALDRRRHRSLSADRRLRSAASRPHQSARACAAPTIARATSRRSAPV